MLAVYADFSIRRVRRPAVPRQPATRPRSVLKSD
jgi:hypothetical protein